MLRLAHGGTLALTVVLGVAAGCSEARTTDAGQGGGGRAADAGSRDRDAGSALLDAGAGTGGSRVVADAAVRGNVDGGGSRDPECSVDSDCVLTPRGCCFPCSSSKVEDYLAVPRSKQSEVAKAQCPSAPVGCSPCPRVAHDPLASIVHSACVNRRCAVVDLRALPLSSCTKDSECMPVGYGCCGASSEDPEGWFGAQNDAGLEILLCVPAQPCTPPAPHGEPLTFCAQDNHCAVRRRERVMRVESATCFSPTQNLDQAYEPAAVGCDCIGSIRVCKQDSTGRRVGLICDEQAFWKAVEDGPCGSQQ